MFRFCWLKENSLFLSFIVGQICCSHYLSIALCFSLRLSFKYVFFLHINDCIEFFFCVLQFDKLNWIET